MREARRERDRAVRVPATLVRELAEAESAGFEAWQAARANADFSLFRDPLERLIALRREEADAVGYEGGERYDALLDQYEPDMRVARLEPLLHGLRDELVPFAREIAARPRPDDAFVHRTYPAQEQRAVGARLAAAIGFDFEAGRLDEAAHPFASGFAPGDVRLTTRESETDLFAGLFAVLHEAGHGLYEQGLTGDDRGHVLRPRHVARPARVAVALLGEHGRPLARVLGAASGPRSRTRSPSQLADVSLDAVRARRQPRRAVADPRRGRRGHLSPARLPALRAGARARARRSRRGRSARQPGTSACARSSASTPPNDGVGVLQDVHWSAGLIGYFPTYTLGTLYSAQFLAAIERELGPIDAIVRAGEYDRLLGWMREHVHSRGALVAPEQIARDATGEAPGHAALMRYLRVKYGELYDLGG